MKTERQSKVACYAILDRKSFSWEWNERNVFPISFSLYLTLFPQQLSQSRSLLI